jgi:hypothetical protein
LRAHHARPREEAEIGGPAGNDVRGSADNADETTSAENRGPAAVAKTVSVGPNLSCGEATMGKDGAAASLLLFRA